MNAETTKPTLAEIHAAYWSAIDADRKFAIAVYRFDRWSPAASWAPEVRSAFEAKVAADGEYRRLCTISR